MKKKIAPISVLISTGIMFFLGSCTFPARYIYLNFPDVNDYKKLPNHPVSHDPSKSFRFKENKDYNIAGLLPVSCGNNIVRDLDQFLTDTRTSAFIIIRNDTVLFEKYYHGHTRSTLSKTFSISKNVMSALIGIAIDEGLIASVNDPVVKYIPELKDGRLSGMTIQNCLSLASGIRADEGEIWPWNTKVRVYYSPNVRKLLSNISYDSEPGKTFHVEEMTPTLLGLVLERATGIPVSAYLEKKIWKKLGMEHDALWVVDSRREGFDMVNSGLTAIPMDMAKLARLMLENGKWENENIISEQWIRRSTRPDTLSLSYWRNIEVYNGRDVYFNDMWWGLAGRNGVYEFNASGHFGQRLYIIPEKNAIVLRFGSSSGKIDWTAFIHNLSAKL